MNETQIYSAIMFFAGVALTQAVFYFDRQKKKSLFYLRMSAAILQILDSVHSIHMAALEYAKDALKNIEEDKREEYLLKESQKVSVFMHLYVLVLIKAVPEEGRKHISYKDWTEAQALIQQLRGLIKNEQSKRGALED